MKWTNAGMIAAVVGMGLGFGGCGEEPPPPVVQTPPPPPPSTPPPPAVTPIDQLMADLNIDKRVVLPEERAPDNNADRQAVLEFYDAMARGNSQALRSMLAETDKRELDALVENGAWKTEADRIKRINVETGTNSLSQKCTLAIIEVSSGAVTDFEPQLWYYVTDDENPSFEAAPTPPGIFERLSGNRIEAWHQILAEELALADKPEIDLEIAQKNLDRGDDTASSGGGGGGTTPGSAPMPGGGRPVPPTIKPPGLPKPGGG